MHQPDNQDNSFCGIAGVKKHSHMKRDNDGSNGDGARAWERVEKVVFYSDYKYLYHSLLLVIYHFSRSKRKEASESFYRNPCTCSAIRHKTP